jgi:RimJ/RimL family protein N-acetyltransferase
MLGPVIDGVRVRLEPPRAEHAPSYMRWFADMQVTRYLANRHPPTARQEEEFFEQVAQDRTKVLWAIVLKAGDTLIGATGLDKIDWRNGDAESGIMIGDKNQWRQGHATEVMRLRTDYAFRELGLRKIWTGVWLPNHGSRRALEKTGYRQCGLMRRHHLVDGELRDVWLAEIHRDDWARAQEAPCSAP